MSLEWDQWLAIALLVGASVLGFATVILGVVVVAEYEWPRRLLGLFVSFLGLGVIFVAFVGISGELVGEGE